MRRKRSPQSIENPDPRNKRERRTMRTMVALLALTGVVLAEDKPAAKKDVVIHAVIFTMKEGTPDKMVDEVIADCHKMLAKIKSVRSLKAGRPTKERAEKVTATGYHVGMVILVDDFAGLKAYLDDPIHKEFVEKWIKHFDISKLKVYDFTDDK
jgi:hypothetical protein